MDEVCGCCKFWLRRTDYAGERGGGYCVRFPPVFKEEAMNDGWPNVHQQSWCGEFSAGSDQSIIDGLGRFDHHPDPAIDFEIEVQSLEARLFDAKGGISKPGTSPETINAVLRDIERALTFRVGGDVGAVSAKQVLRRLETEAIAALPLNAEGGDK